MAIDSAASKHPVCRSQCESHDHLISLTQLPACFGVCVGMNNYSRALACDPLQIHPSTTCNKVKHEQLKLAASADDRFPSDVQLATQLSAATYSIIVYNKFPRIGSACIATYTWE